MVRLLSLSVRNFKKLRFDSSIEFSDGITLIAGLNESGKSSMLDAILYSLFGRVIRPPKARNEDLISYDASEATVTLQFEITDRRFRVTRHLYRSKPTRANLDEITAKGAVRSIATGQEKVNDEIVNLLGGITYQEIISSTVVAQKELDKLIELDKDDRRKVINAFLNLESFNTVIATLSEERKDLEGTGTRIGRVQAETEKLALLKQELDQYKRNAEEKSVLEQQNITLAEELKALQTKYQEQDNLCKSLFSYETAARTKENLNLRLVSKKQIYEDHSTRSERLHREVESIREELGGFAAYDKAEPLFERIRLQLEKAKALSLELSTAERSWQATQKEVGAVESTLASKSDVKLRNQAKQVEKPILPHLISSALLLVGGFVAFIVGVLPLAAALIAFGFVALALVVMRVNATASLLRHQSILGDLRYLDGKRRDLVGAEQRYIQAERGLKAAGEELVNLSNLISGYNETFRTSRNMGTMEAVQSLLDAAQRDRERRNELEVKLRTVRGEMQKILPENEMVNLQKQIEAIEREFNRLVLPQLPVGILFSPRLLSDALVGRDATGRKMAAAQSRIEQNSQRVDNLNKCVTENADIVPKVQSQEELVKKLEHQLKVVRRAIEGIQATAESLRTRIRPSVQGHMASILPALTSSRYKAAILDENYGLQVWDPEAGEYKPRDVYSGGAEDQFLLAMRLAFALALLPEVKGRKPEFVFLDEPLGSSDDVRRSGILEYLASDLSKKFKQIFVISHVGGLEDYAQNTITLDEGRVV